MTGKPRGTHLPGVIVPLQIAGGGRLLTKSAFPPTAGLLVKSRFFANDSCNEGRAALSSCLSRGKLVPPELAKVLKVLTAYTLRMTLYSY
jgi:hypothetical protein